MNDSYDNARSMTAAELEAKALREAPLMLNTAWSTRNSDDYRNAVNVTREEAEANAAAEWERPPTLWQRIKNAIFAKPTQTPP